MKFFRIHLVHITELNLFVLFRTYREQLQLYGDFCENLLNELEQSLRSLLDLENQYHTVSTKTGELHQACEALLQEQVRYDYSLLDLCFCFSH
jgi:hypothetical protein